jgi:predicted secreted protein
MTIRKTRRKNDEKPFHEAVTDLLFSAMANHEDFVLTYEVNPTTGKKEIHVMSGKLISSDLVATFKDHVVKQVDEGSGHHIWKME